MLRTLTILSLLAIVAAAAIEVVSRTGNDTVEPTASKLTQDQRDDLAELSVPKSDGSDSASSSSSSSSTGASSTANAATDVDRDPRTDTRAPRPLEPVATTTSSTGASSSRSSTGAARPATAASTSTTTTGPAVPRSTTMLVIGDSLTVGTDPYLRTELKSWDLTIDSAVGRHLATGMDLYDAAKAKGLPDTVALGLLTNDAGSSLAAFQADVRRTITDARARKGRVIWATVHDGKQSFTDANAWLRKAARQNADVMRLVDWDALVTKHPDYLAGDHVHGTAAAYAARAKLYARAARDEHAPVILV